MISEMKKNIMCALSALVISGNLMANENALAEFRQISDQFTIKEAIECKLLIEEKREDGRINVRGTDLSDKVISSLKRGFELIVNIKVDDGKLNSSLYQQYANNGRQNINRLTVERRDEVTNNCAEKFATLMMNGKESQTAKTQTRFETNIDLIVENLEKTPNAKVAKLNKCTLQRTIKAPVKEGAPFDMTQISIFQLSNIDTLGIKKTIETGEQDAILRELSTNNPYSIEFKNNRGEPVVRTQTTLIPLTQAAAYLIKNPTSTSSMNKFIFLFKTKKEAEQMMPVIKSVVDECRL